MGMHQTLRQRWREIMKGRPGQRFQDRYAAARKSRADASWGQRARRLLRLCIALLAIGAAIFLMVFPGPAIPFFFLGGTLLAGESLGVARLLDWIELRLRALWKWGHGHWRQTPRWGQAVLVALVVCLSASSTYVFYRLAAS